MGLMEFSDVMVASCVQRFSTLLSFSSILQDFTCSLFTFPEDTGVQGLKHGPFWFLWSGDWDTWPCSWECKLLVWCMLIWGVPNLWYTIGLGALASLRSSSCHFIRHSLDSNSWEVLQLLVLNKPKKIFVLLFTEVKKSYKNNKTQSTENKIKAICVTVIKSFH